MSRTVSSPNKKLDLSMAPTNHALRQINEYTEMRDCTQTSKSAAPVPMNPQHVTNQASQVSSDRFGA